MSFSKNLKTLIKYAVLTLIGILLFQIGAAQALAFRGYHAIGGEVFFPVYPRVLLDHFNHDPGFQRKSEKRKRMEWKQ